jgi:hypothetical protein
MGSYDFAMWSRAAREIERAYARHGSPLRALAAMSPTIPVLHLYAQPDDADLSSFQQAYARDHTWFQVHKLAAHSQFPMFEVPEEMAGAIRLFAATPWPRRGRARSSTGSRRPRKSRTWWFTSARSRHPVLAASRCASMVA